MYVPSTRLLSTLELLQTHEIISGREMSKRLEVDGRTVRRYVSQLTEMGFPIETVQGKYGGYKLRKSYRLPPLIFNSDEVLTLATGLMLTRQLGLFQSMDAADQAIKKLRANLPESLLEQIDTFTSVLMMADEPAYYELSSEAVLTLSQAVRDERAVWIHYMGRNQIASRRKIDPYALIFMIGMWYVPAYCHMRQAIRVFRVDRMSHSQLLQQTFDKPADFDAWAVVEESIARTPNSWTVRVLLHTTLEEARKQIPKTTAVFRPSENGIEMQSTVGDLQVMVLRLLAVDFDFTILEPPQLVDAFAEVAMKASAVAGQ